MRSTAAITSTPARAFSRKTRVNFLVADDVAAHRTGIDERGRMRGRREIAAIAFERAGAGLQLTTRDDAKSASAPRHAAR